ncbi:MAG: YrbL family protein [Desulforhopalus sp.]|nr:YrbL family protein [Desulforhopalus sp.]
MKERNILYLDHSLLIGSGGVRHVYRHPHSDDRCIKIIHNPRRQRSVKREIRYLRRYERQGKPFEHLTRFHGWCSTNLGRGAIFDLICDHTGSCSQPLSMHATGQASPCLAPEEIFHLLQALLQHLLSHQIIICDPAPHNLVVQYPFPGKPKLVIIDGIGNPHFIKLADHLRSFAHQLIKKKWRYYVETNPLLAQAFASQKQRNATENTP